MLSSQLIMVPVMVHFFGPLQVRVSFHDPATQVSSVFFSVPHARLSPLTAIMQASPATAKSSSHCELMPMPEHPLGPRQGMLTIFPLWQRSAVLGSVHWYLPLLTQGLPGVGFRPLHCDRTTTRETENTAAAR